LDFIAESPAIWPRLKNLRMLGPVAVSASVLVGCFFFGQGQVLSHADGEFEVSVPPAPNLHPRWPSVAGAS
jgi:hypothetical protein